MNLLPDAHAHGAKIFTEVYYSDIDRDGHEISRFGGRLSRDIFSQGAEGKYNHEGKYYYLGATNT